MKERSSSRKLWSGRTSCALPGAFLLALAASSVPAQQVLHRGRVTVLVEPYAPNIVRVSLSLLDDQATAAPGYGISAKASATGWTNQSGPQGDEIRSSLLTVSVAPQGPPRAPTGTQADIARFFGGSVPGVGIQIATPDGKSLVNMQGWSMAVPNYKDGTAGISHDRRPTDPPFYTVGANFSAADE